MSQMEEVFGNTGWLREKLPNYVSRPGQIAMAKAVEGAIKDGRHLLAEGPTGTGKSLSYGVPAAAYALTHDTTIVIVTANITLQEQLIKKDIPLIAEMLHGRLKRYTVDPIDVDPFGVNEAEMFYPKLTYHLMKGMSNYLCLDKLRQLDKKSESWLDEIKEWARTTKTGDKSELLIEYAPSYWNQVSTTSEQCIRDACDFKQNGECFVFKMRGNYSKAREEDGFGGHLPVRGPNIIVTNYHMLYTDFVVQTATEGHAQLLPDYRLLIMDEAHEAVDIAMSFMGFELFAAKLQWCIKGLKKLEGLDTPVANKIQRCSEQFFRQLQKFRDYRNNDNIIRQPLGYDEDIVEALEEGGDYVNKCIAKRHPNIAEEARLKMLAGAFRNRASELDSVCYGEKPLDDPNGERALPKGSVFYTEEDRKVGPKLCCKVIEVQKFLREYVLNKKTLIATSATLTTNDNFNFIAEEMGLEKDEYSSMIAESPFDPEKVLVVVPDGLPSPKKRDEHIVAVPKVIEQVVNDIGGRTMALFTSYKALGVASKYLENNLKGIVFLIQGEIPKSKIIDIFKKEKNCLILATSSFWQGIDIPGQALSCLIIDKFPFIHPGDPVLKFMQEKWEERGESGFRAFMEYSIPKAVIALKQGVGRLIRTESDYGAVVICDNRIVTTRYGEQFESALPRGHLRTEDIEDVRFFLEDQAAGA